MCNDQTVGSVARACTDTHERQGATHHFAGNTSSEGAMRGALPHGLTCALRDSQEAGRPQAVLVLIHRGRDSHARPHARSSRRRPPSPGAFNAPPQPHPADPEAGSAATALQPLPPTVDPRSGYMSSLHTAVVTRPHAPRPPAPPLPGTNRTHISPAPRTNRTHMHPSPRPLTRPPAPRRPSHRRASHPAAHARVGHAPPPPPPPPLVLSGHAASLTPY